MAVILGLLVAESFDAGVDDTGDGTAARIPGRQEVVGPMGMIF